MSNDRGKRYTAEEKQRALEDFERSGLSASRFCKEAGVSYPTLRRWLGRDAACPVKLVEIDADRRSAHDLGALLPNGLRLEFACDAPPSEVRRWIGELGSC